MVSSPTTRVVSFLILQRFRNLFHARLGPFHVYQDDFDGNRAEPTYLETRSIRVQTYGDVARRHLTRPESKAARADGQVCEPSTAGELQRLHVLIDDAVHIGKESHDLEEVQAWLTSPSTTYVHYIDDRAEWERDKQILKLAPRKLLAEWSGLHVRSIKEILNTPRLPHRRHRRILHEITEILRSQSEMTPPKKGDVE